MKKFDIAKRICSETRKQSLSEWNLKWNITHRHYGKRLLLLFQVQACSVVWEKLLYFIPKHIPWKKHGWFSSKVIYVFNNTRRFIFMHAVYEIKLWHEQQNAYNIIESRVIIIFQNQTAQSYINFYIFNIMMMRAARVYRVK